MRDPALNFGAGTLADLAPAEARADMRRRVREHACREGASGVEEGRFACGMCHYQELEALVIAAFSPS